jgi:glucoamylase
VFDRVEPVYQRYCTPEGRAACRRGIEIYSLRRPIQRVNAGDTLRILDGDRFEVLWSTDGWKTTHITHSRSLGSAGFAADLETEPGGGQISWTLHWRDYQPHDQDPSSGASSIPDRWLGYNVEVEIVSR